MTLNVSLLKDLMHTPAHTQKLSTHSSKIHKEHIFIFQLGNVHNRLSKNTLTIFEYCLTLWDYSLYKGGLLFIVVDRWFFLVYFLSLDIKDKQEALKWADYLLYIVSGMYVSRPSSRQFIYIYSWSLSYLALESAF